MSRSRCRAATKRRIKELVGQAQTAEVAAFTGLQVAYTWQGDQTSDRTLYLAPSMDGTAELDSITTSPTTVDEWRIQGRIEVHGQDSAEAAEQAVEDVLAGLDDLLRLNPRLRHDTYTASEPAAFSALRSAVIGAVNGPNHGYPQPNGDQMFAWADFFIDCTADIDT